MATHSSVLAWRIPGTGEPGGLLSLGSHRVGQDWSDLAAAAAWNQNNIAEELMVRLKLTINKRREPTVSNILMYNKREIKHCEEK